MNSAAKNHPMRVGGLDLAQLIALAGKSPAYVYERAAIDANIAALRSALPNEVLLHYSLKANPLPQLVTHIAQQVDGLDVASHTELITAIGASNKARTISFSGPGKNDQELLAAVTAGIVIHVESWRELQRIAKIAQTADSTPRISVRINPDFSIRQSGMVMGGGAQPFGVDREQAADVLTAINDYGFTCEGLHCYVGSQILSADIIIDAQSRILDMMTHLAQSARLAPDNCIFNIGGGFGIPYFQGETKLDISAVGDALSARLGQLQQTLGEVRVAVETGRYVVGNAGIYIARVIDRKQSRGKTYLVVDGGLNHHLAASGNLGQVIRRNYPVSALAVSSASLQAIDEMETVSIVGPLCTPLDVLANDIELPHLDVGDCVAVLQSGAYGFSASPHGFLSHAPPVEIIV